MTIVPTSALEVGTDPHSVLAAEALAKSRNDEI